jgi:glycerate kinase
MEMPRISLPVSVEPIILVLGITASTDGGTGTAALIM